MERTKFIGQNQNRGNPYLTTDLFNRLFKRYGGDPVALYAFYCHTAVWQKTNQPKVTDKYCINALKWGSAKFYKNKELLKKLKLIKPIEHRDERGRVDSWYIKVNHYVNQNPQNKSLDDTRSKSPEPSKPESGSEESNTIKKIGQRNAYNRGSLATATAPTANKELIALLQANKDTICPNGMTFILSFNDFDKRSKCHSCPITDTCKKLNEGNITTDGHIYNPKKYKEDDGRKYNLCPDGNYRNKAGEIYIP